MPAWRFVVPTASAVAAVAVGLAACSSPQSTPRETEVLCPALGVDARGHREAAFLALDDAGRLTRFDLPGGQATASRRFGTARDEAGMQVNAMGRLLDDAADGEGVAMLDRNAPSARDTVLVLDPRSLQTRCRFPLPGGVRYSALAIAQERVFAFGNRLVGEGRSGALYSVLEPGANGWVTRTVRKPNRDWFVQWGAVSVDGRKVVLTYHGSGTTGADLVPSEESDDGMSAQTFIGEVHGAVEASGDGFIATNGADLIRLEDPSEPLGADAFGVHVMHFALDDTGSGYVSSCGNAPAVHALDLASGALRKTETGPYCGEVFGVVRSRYLALGSTRTDSDGFPVSPAYRLRLIDVQRGGAGTPLGKGVVQSVRADPGSPD